MREIEHSGISTSLSNLLCRRYSRQQKTPVFDTGVLLWIAAATEMLSDEISVCPRWKADYTPHPALISGTHWLSSWRGIRILSYFTASVLAITAIVTISKLMHAESDYPGRNKLTIAQA